ncbi:site-specific DNA-methyltransferase [Vibrio vulnificus]|uniref:site-specific DNA-methyltransferase n=1 Tax=Vibrio vulnificus TaxID=672 RepID=UPI0028DD53D3|nr:site-specific DNA-methyltransferase [Vibrio vulnificus]MDT8805350.1 site-specific DNA-methyltransferase [Vibrio vulnificus]
MTNEEQQTNVETYEFEPIKGYPMLNWKGKRPFRSTQYFPAQLKEVYGQEDDNGWINKIFWGDNLQVMSHLLKEFRGKVDFVYIDPPFDSKADYKKTIKLKNKVVGNEHSSFEEKQYTDMWSNDDYLQFMYERLIILRELLSSSGVIALHCDYHKSHHLRIILDEVFGHENFINEVIWKRGNNKKTKVKYSQAHDNIFIYSKGDNYKFNPQYQPYSQAYVEKYYGNKDPDGRRYQLQSMYGKGAGPALYFGDKLISPPAGLHWRWNQERISQAMEDGVIVFPNNGEGNPRFKDYLDDKEGNPIRTIWGDISEVNSQALDKSNYPTQKPVELVQRLLLTFTDVDDLILDCFMGSGTSQLAAHNENRRFLGTDINSGAIKTALRRLVEAGSNFEIYSVNNYEIFRNPVEAKDLLIEALEIQRLDSNVAYDGEKDGYKVKIMPVNRIATKEDLNELVANFPYKKFEERKAANPNKPVEEIMLVCMGHEPGLGATLENECGYKLKVEVVDILRDKSDLTFKYDSEAVIKVQDGKLIVDAFYPRNLLQKLSQQKDDVAEWREMVESIMIDWNYDGAVMEPVVIDIPDKNEFVAGEYEIPEGASNIKIKITDLLSESYEEVIAHG